MAECFLEHPVFDDQGRLLFQFKVLEEYQQRLDDLKAMLYFFPQLYVDTGVLQLAVPREEYYAYLEELVRAGYIDRIMFGSDQMNWPGLIEEGIRAINDAPFTLGGLIRLG